MQDQDSDSKVWTQPTTTWVVQQLQRELAQLNPADRVQLEALLVSPYTVPVESHPGEIVVVVAKWGEQVLYWSDIEEGWELDRLNEAGGIPERGASQFDLSHIVYQLFRSPESPSARWSVWRQDDNGNRFEVSSGHTEQEARRIAQEYEARGHKQSYTVVREK